MITARYSQVIMNIQLDFKYELLFRKSVDIYVCKHNVLISLDKLLHYNFVYVNGYVVYWTRMHNIVFVICSCESDQSASK